MTSRLAFEVGDGNNRPKAGLAQACHPELSIVPAKPNGWRPKKNRPEGR